MLNLFIKIDRIHSFDIRHSLFDIRFFKVSFSIRPAVFLASGAARVKLHSGGGAEPLNPQTDILTDALEFTTFAE